jgi:dTDP-glucose pyrophosphorylase/predicted transcriptional regulator
MEKEKLTKLLVSTKTTLKQTMRKMNETAEKILFVTDQNKKLLGTITDGDIRRGIIKGVSLSSPAKRIMRTKFISLDAKCGDLLGGAKRLMKKHTIEHIPVLDDSGKIIDFISWLECLSSKVEHRKPPKKMDNPVVIMAGGKGTRLAPFTKILPKPLIPVGEKTIIEHIMEKFYKNGFYNFKIILNYKKEMIKAYLTENNLPYQIEFIEEESFQGTAGGLSLLNSHLKKTFFVTNCDTILDGDYFDFFQWHKERKNLVTIIGSHKEFILPYGVLVMKNENLHKINEKPFFDLFINSGTYIFEPEGLDAIGENRFLNMDVLIEKLMKRDKSCVGVYPHFGNWFDIGQWDEYRKTMKHFGDLYEEL